MIHSEETDCKNKDAFMRITYRMLMILLLVVKSLTEAKAPPSLLQVSAPSAIDVGNDEM